MWMDTKVLMELAVSFFREREIERDGNRNLL
jgi:hypothetical protein